MENKKNELDLSKNINGTTVPKVIEYEVNGQPIQLTMGTIQKFIAKGNDYVTNEEIGMFMSLCKYQKLNPFLGDAYLVKYDKTKPAQNVVSKEAFMKRAFAQPNFKGIRAGIIIQRNDKVYELEGSFMLKTDKLLGGWAEVHVEGKTVPYVIKVDLEEYHKGQSTWKAMPKTMIRKVAMVQALREAFPVELGAMYIDEEPKFDNNSNVIDQVTEEVNEQTAKEELPFPEVAEDTGEVRGNFSVENEEDPF